MSVRASQDFVSITQFRKQSAKLLKRAAKTGQPIVFISRKGKATGVIVSPAEYDRLIASERLRQGVKRGLEDIQAGRVVDHETVVKEMKKRFGRSKT